MKQIRKHRILLFIGSLTQVTFVAMNVVFISKGFLIPMAVTSLMASLIWTLNVKHISIGSMTDRLCYASGAALGTITGFFASHYISRLL